MQVSSIIPVADHKGEVVTVDEKNTPVLYLREEKYRLEMEVKNKETKMEALKKEIEEKEKKKKEEEKEIEEKEKKKEGALANKALIDKKIARLQRELQRREGKALASSSDGDKSQRQADKIESAKNAIKAAESENAQYVSTIEACEAAKKRMESNWAILNQDIIRLKQEYDSLNKEWAKARSDLSALLADHPYLLSDASKEAGAEEKSEVCVTIVSCMRYVLSKCSFALLMVSSLILRICSPNLLFTYCFLSLLFLAETGMSTCWLLMLTVVTL